MHCMFDSNPPDKFPLTWENTEIDKRKSKVKLYNFFIYLRDFNFSNNSNSFPGTYPFWTWTIILFLTTIV